VRSGRGFFGLSEVSVSDDDRLYRVLGDSGAFLDMSESSPEAQKLRLEATDDLKALKSRCQFSKDDAGFLGFSNLSRNNLITITDSLAEIHCSFD
jgi:hypothetical protein